MGEAPVVQDEEIGLGEGQHQLPVGAIGPGVHEVFAEQAWQPELAHRVALPTRQVPERAREPRLAGAGGADEEERLVLADPVAAGELSEPRFLEAAFRAKVHVFDAYARVAQSRELQEACGDGRAASIVRARAA